MNTILSALILPVLNIGLIWLLMAAPLGRRTIVQHRHLRASPQTIWDRIGPTGDVGAWSPSVLSLRRSTGVAGRVDISYRQSDRTGRPVVRTLEFGQTVMSSGGGFSCHLRVVADSTLDVGFWRHFSESRTVAPGTDGAQLTVSQSDRYRGLAFYLYRYFALRRELTALERFVDGAKPAGRSLFTHPGVQLASAVFSTLLLWPFFGLTTSGLLTSILLTMVIILHELGHMAAYRAFGHRSAHMIFVPLLGGIAVGGRPYDSQFEQSTCALMGAGMSAFLVPMLIAAEDAGMAEVWPPQVSGALLAMLLILGAFNLLNLLPMGRFDGGQVLRPLFSSRLAQAGGSFAIAAVILGTGWRIGVPPLALFAALAVLTLVSLVGSPGVQHRAELVPMAPGERLLTGFGLFAAVSIHAYAVIHACDALFG